LFPTPRRAAQFGASMTVGALIGAVVVLIIKYSFASSGAQLLALLVFFLVLITVAVAYTRWRRGKLQH
jgi:uncharacterized membrane protein YdjX (TVP38/TMEM64 family)